MAKQRINHLSVERLEIEQGAVISGGQTVDLLSAATDEKAKVSSNDTTPGFLNGKLVAGTNITLTENNNGGNETLTISAAGGGVTGFTGSQNTAAPNNTVNASRILVDATSTDADFIIQAKGQGSLLAQLPDSTTTGGNKRGYSTVDLQMRRSNANQVASGNFQGILAGENNRINSNASYSLIGTGFENLISGTVDSNSSSIGSFVGSGTYCWIVNSNYSVISGGDSCYIENSKFSVVSGGQSGQVLSSLAGAVIGGQYGLVESADYGAVLGGSYNRCKGPYSVVSGERALSERRGQRIYGAVPFSANANGTCQHEMMDVCAITTGATSAVLTADRGAATTSNSMVIENNTSKTFRAVILAHQTVSPKQAIAWEIKGLIGNYGGATSIIGTPTTVLLGDSTSSGATVSVTADDTLDCLTITGTGSADKTFRWHATVEFTTVFG